MKQKFSLVAIALVLVLFVSCDNFKSNDTNTSEVIVDVESEQTITEQEVLDIQKVWGEGIVRIGKVYTDGGDYAAEAEKHIDELYGYNLGTVFFKPTMASEKQFRLSKRGALSYFVGHDTEYAEDHGFAIKPWSNVRWESIGVKTIGNMSIALGNYYFTPANGDDEVKVEYTFAYTKDIDGKLRIVGHGSHLPYSPK